MNKNNIGKLIMGALSDGFLKATVWMFLGTGILSFGNYLYHVLMGRLLGPVEYGVLESIIAFSYILSVPLMTLNLIIVKHVSTYKGKGETSSIASFYYFLKQLFLKQGLVICLILILLSPLITTFLHLPSNWLSVLLVAFVFVGLFQGLGRGFLQGMTNFFGLAVINSVEAIVKISLAVVLVFIGFKSIGGVLGIVSGAALSYWASTLFLKKINLKNPTPFKDKHLVGKYTVPTFITTLSLTSLFTTDILLARHFLTPQLAGFYAALSVLGKVVFFAVSPVSLVMFPFVSERHSRGEKYNSILLTSLGLTILGGAIVVLLYYFFPALVVNLLFGKNFIGITGYVWIFGGFIAIYSTAYLLLNFFLSIHKTFPSYLAAAAALFQIFGIIVFHSSIIEIASVSILITFLLLILLLLYYANGSIKLTTSTVRSKL